MDINLIIKQSTDICVNQISYIEYGLKQSKDTSYLITTINVVINIVKIYDDIDYKDKQNLIPLFNRIGLNITI